MSDDVRASTSGGHDDDQPPGWRMTRRAFLAGCAAVAGAAAVTGKLVDDTFLGGLQPAEAAAPAGGRAARPHRALQQLRRRLRPPRPRGRRQGEADRGRAVGRRPRSPAARSPKAYPPRICLRGVVAAREPLQRRPHQVPLQARRRARLGPVAAHQLGRGDHDDRRQPADGAGQVRARTPSGSRPTPARWPSSRVSSASASASRSAIGAVAGDFEGDNEGDSSTPAGWNYVLVDPDESEQRRRLLRRSRIDRLPERQGDRAVGQQRRRDLDPGLARHEGRPGPGRHARRHRPALHGHLGRLRRLAADPARHRHGPDRRRDQLRHPEQALRRAPTCSRTRWRPTW